MGTSAVFIAIDWRDSTRPKNSLIDDNNKRIINPILVGCFTEYCNSIRLCSKYYIAD